jgi:hypothetical protein
MKENILVVCPGCSLKFKVPVHLIGKRARCNDCQTIFVLEAPAEMMEDTVAEWLFEGAVPPKPIDSAAGGKPVKAGAPAPAQPAGGPTKTAAQAAVHAAPAPAEAHTSAAGAVRLERIDDMGAYFEFPAERLPDYQLRGSLPRKCIACSSQESLRVQLLVWTDRLPPRDQLRLQESQASAAGMLADYQGQPLEEYLGRLPQVKMLPVPYSLPLPYYVCPDCSTVGEVFTHVLAHGQKEFCQIMIANLEVAADFLMANNGADSEDYHMILEAWQRQKEDPWRTLSLGVRNRLSNWFEKKTGERFIEYYPDAEFSKAELGTAGLILTNHRGIYKKFAALREFDMNKATNLRCTQGPDKWQLELSQMGTRAATFSLMPQAGARFVAKCRSIWPGLHIAEQMPAAQVK